MRLTNSKMISKPNNSLLGGIYGLTMEGSNLLDSYHAIVEALAYESKYILDELRSQSSLNHKN